MERAELRAILESMIFVAEEPLTENVMLMALADAGVGREEIRECLEEIESDLNATPARGIGLVNVAGGYQFRTKPSCAEWLRRINLPKPMRLSAPALESLAIVAYRQPIMRSEIEKIRGVDSGGVLKTLLERRLLRIVGRSQEPGQPLLYGTTKEFLEVFSLNALNELPTLKDLDELMRERRAAQTQAQAGTQDSTALHAQGDDEDPTEAIEGDDEEETEIIRRRSLDEDEEEEDKDMEALTDLEGRLKDVRRLERAIFPKPLNEGGEGGEGVVEGEQGEQLQSASANEGGSVGEAGASEGEDPSAVHGDPAEDPASADDRPFD
ncbi:MAG: SMC-Scp complex subunit ScpB [bacterium]